MRIGDVIYDNDTVLIASASFNKEEPCKECFFYDGHECQSNRYIECWDKSINKDLIMIPFENNKVQDSKMMDHSSKTVTESLNRLAKKWEKDGKRLWLYSASGVLTVMMHGDREDNPIPEMLPNAGTNPDNIITTISGIGNDGGDW